MERLKNAIQKLESARLELKHVREGEEYEVKGAKESINHALKYLLFLERISEADGVKLEKGEAEVVAGIPQGN